MKTEHAIASPAVLKAGKMDGDQTPHTESSTISIKMSVDIQPGSETSNQLIMKTAEKISEAGWNSA